ncbi:unnamed protein product [Porites lobata]|uniref:Helitron helicase-like domain-containing protein n=1 Tax=Porites lobata TaxID=104759 RepID=A0ABN8Q362_9CNID|nr:unnamed protein product [Porites lobata]
MVNEKRGLPSFFMTGSCAEFYFPPLRRLLEEYILQTKGEEVNLAEDSNARFKAVQENTHVVVSFFDLRTQAYHEKILKLVFGVSDYWYHYEFAKSRGQIHWHQLSWREDRQPHQLLHEAREDGCEEEEYAARLSQWADETFAMTALHPAGNDEEGQPRKDLWPPPEGTAEPISDDRDPLVKMLMQIAATQDAILEDHLLLVNRVGLHSCSDYCLRTPRHPEQGLQPRERICRMEFGSEFHPGKKVHSNPEIVEDHNGAPRLEMPRDHPRVVQHSRYQLQSNGNVPVVSGGSTHATWPLNEDYCRTMLLLHWPSWFDIQEVKGDTQSWIDRFKDFFASDDCPTFVKAQVAKARRYADHPQEPVFEEDEEDDAVEAEEQPDWVDVYAGRTKYMRV